MHNPTGSSAFHYVIAAQNRQLNGQPGNIYNYLYGDVALPLPIQDDDGRNPRGAFWSGIAVSYDCSKMIAIEYETASGQPGSVYRWILDLRFRLSTWEKVINAPTGYWVSIASSKRYFTRPSGPWAGVRYHDSSPVFAIAQEKDSTGLPGAIYVSFDYGSNWRLVSALQPASWRGLALNVDGSILVATAQNQSTLYVSGLRPDPPIGVVVAAGAAAGVALGVGIGTVSGSKVICYDSITFTCDHCLTDEYFHICDYAYGTSRHLINRLLSFIDGITQGVPVNYVIMQCTNAAQVIARGGRPSTGGCVATQNQVSK